jgi:3',5'-cyclic AMP phosphodiesterase CpdA
MRLVHLSDLHFGHHDIGLAQGLAHDIESGNPDLVIVSGDFTQIGSRKEFEAARAFLDTLTVPYFAVPGNHDVPERNLLKRFINPYGHYKRYIHHDLEPFEEFDGVTIAGLRTSRRARLSLNWSDGTISRDQLEDLEARFAKTDPDAVKVVVAHHPLVHPEEEMQRQQRLVKRADLALETFARIGVRLVLSGHFHMTYVRRHHEPGAVAVAEPTGLRKSAAAPILVAQAASTISTRLRGHPNAYNLIDIDRSDIKITVREWTEGGWTTRERALEPV